MSQPPCRWHVFWYGLLSKHKHHLQRLRLRCARKQLRVSSELSNENGLQVQKGWYDLYKKQTAFKRRLGLSSISLPTAEMIPRLKRHDLSNACCLMIRRFKKAVHDSTAAVAVDWTQFSKYFWRLLYTILNYSLNMINIDRKLASQTIVTSEADFITKYVDNFFWNCMLAYQDCLFVRWDVPTAAYDGADKRKRPDLTICSVDGVEVGCGEVKPPYASVFGAEEDCCWVPEHLRKLPQAGTSENRSITFGFRICGEDLELSTMEFKGGSTCTLSLKLSNCQLPATPSCKWKSPSSSYSISFIWSEALL